MTRSSGSSPTVYIIVRDPDVVVPKPDAYEAYKGYVEAEADDESPETMHKFTSTIQSAIGIRIRYPESWGDRDADARE